jgi:hypothetical protein
VWGLTLTSGGDVPSRMWSQVEAHPGSVSVSLYQTPDLRGLVKRFAPPRWNEIVGVSHYKAFVFDDDTMLSGYNLDLEAGAPHTQSHCFNHL